MDINRNRKLSVDPPVIPAHQEQVVQSHVELDKWMELNSSLEILGIPQDGLIEIFKFCPLPTRCRLRRVCHYWKDVVSLPDVNEIIIVSRRCLLLSNPEYRRDRLTRSTSNEAASLEGWYDAAARTNNPTIDLSGHQRHGLLGPHVRIVLYDCVEEYKQHCYNFSAKLPRIIRSIGYYCTRVEHIILWRLHSDDSTLPRRAKFLPDPPSLLPQPQRLTLLAARCRLGYFSGFYNAGPWEPYLEFGLADFLIASVPFWQDEGSQSEENFLNQFLPPCTVDQRAWVARFAPHLPNSYQDLFRRGLEFHSGFERLDKVYSLDLKTEDYSQVDTFFLRVLAHCILHEKIDTEPPPKSFAM